MEKLIGPLWDNREYPDHILTFTLEGKEYGVEAGIVRQVIRWTAPTSFPVEDFPLMAGFIGLKGVKTPLIDIRRLIGYPAREHRPDDRIVFLSRDRLVFGFAVDSIRGVLSCQGNVQKSSGGNGLPLTLHCVGSRDLVLIDPFLLLNDEQASLIMKAVESAPPEKEPVFSAKDRGKNRFDRILNILKKSYDRSVFNAPAQMPENLQKFLIVELAGKLYAFPVEYIREVLRTVAVTPVPLAPPHVAGIINLRGEIISVVSLYEALGLVKPPGANHFRYCITKSGPFTTALMVEDFNRVVVVEKRHIISTPSFGPFIRQMIPFEQGQVPLVDLTALLKSEMIDQSVRR